MPDMNERLATLEQQIKDINKRYDTDIASLNGKMDTLLAKFNQMTGGQKAWFALATLLGALVGIVASLIPTFVGKHP